MLLTSGYWWIFGSFPSRNISSAGSALLDIFFCQITTFIKVLVAFVFGLQTLYLIDFGRIYRLKRLEPKNKGHTNFYECCDLTKRNIYWTYGTVVYFNEFEKKIIVHSIFLSLKFEIKSLRTCHKNSNVFLRKKTIIRFSLSCSNIKA